VVNKPRIKGTAAESAVVAYLQANGFPWAERRSLNGALDKGDLTGTPGLCWEVKVAGSGLKLGPWLKETEAERINSGATHGILVVKPRGLGDKSTGSWLAAMTADDFDRLRLQVEVGSTPSLSFVDVPVREYVQDSVRPGLAVTKTMSSTEVLALTFRPPGTKERPGQWYRVTTLGHMTRMLRAAGYGDPYEG
jgi:hypothetical protein